MPLADINKAIMAEADKEIKAIKAEGEKKLEALKAEWAEKIKERQLKIIQDAQKKANQKIQQMQFKMQAQFQAEILKSKNEVINKAYNQASKKLGELSEKEYEDFMVKLIKKIDTAEGELISAQGKEKILKKALQKTEKKFTISEKTTKDAGGFIFQSSKLEIDNTFSRLIADLRDQTILEVTKILF